MPFSEDLNLQFKIYNFSSRGQPWWPLTETLNQAKLPQKHFVNLTGLLILLILPATT